MEFSELKKQSIFLVYYENNKEGIRFMENDFLLHSEDFSYYDWQVLKNYFGVENNETENENNQ